jgi:hypothetical protein
VLIEESLTDLSILPRLSIIATRVTTLEEEVSKGEFHFHSVEVADKDLQEIIDFVSEKIKDSWYFHLVKDDEMIVMFHRKVFKAHKTNQKEIDEIRDYALSKGIIEEQLPLEKLFDNPYI